MSSSNVEIESIDISSININPYYTRENFNYKELESIVQSIEDHGILQPINLKKNAEGYDLLAGEKRLMAAIMAGYEKIPAIVVDISEEEALILALLERLDNKEIHFFQEAEIYRQLIEDCGLTQEDLAKKLGKSQSTIANKIRLLNLGEEERNFIRESRLSERHARALLRLPEDVLRRELLLRIDEYRLSVKKTEHIIDTMLKDIDLKSRNFKPEDMQKAVNKNICLNRFKKAYDELNRLKIPITWDIIDDSDNFKIVISLEDNSKTD